MPNGHTTRCRRRLRPPCGSVARSGAKALEAWVWRIVLNAGRSDVRRGPPAFHDEPASTNGTNTWTMTGKRGRLTIRERIEWVDTGINGNGDGQHDEVATGTWKVVRGTGAYARIAGGTEAAMRISAESDDDCLSWIRR